jgi:hypothetical protein
MRCFGLFTILALASFTDATAQVLPLQPGQRVRVTAPALGILKQPGSFQAQHGDTLVVIADSVRHYPLTSVTRLERYRGRGSAWATGLGVGAIVGAMVGSGVGVAVAAGEDDPFISHEVIVAAGGVTGAVSGALVGLIVGGLIKTDKWEKVPLERLRVSVVAQRNGFGLGASIAF